ncbi:hypothetical protein Goklo_025225 [Gossypium klotzschianum]|uniref:Uncharacterized protein n=1 Tax=Gossypium klotzschianum TaxID=34286 RepID=A0A7J8WDX5_9ROSI|nr:hypothetical protein [Gossypium klotzschianum]
MGHTHPSNLSKNVQILERVSESGRGKVYRVCSAFASLVP